MGLLSKLNVRQKLTAVSMLSSTSALVAATLAFLALDAYTFGQSMVRRIRAEAEIVGFNSVSPLLFDDRDAAMQTLAGLRAEPAVAWAEVVSAKSHAVFASYARHPSSPAPDAAPTETEGEGHAFVDGGLVMSEPIVFEGRRVGTLYLKAESTEIVARHRQLAWIVAAVLLASLLLAGGISRSLEGTLTRPILHLADVARSVSTGRDYSVRAAGGSRDEVGLLVSTFNQMLDHIERQNADLEESRSELERRVEARTRELAAANKELEAFSYSVSHDLRAPLRAIDGFSRAVLDASSGLDDKSRHYLSRVRAGTQRMAELIDDLLGLARVSRKELTRQAVDVSEAAARVAADLAARDPGRRVELTIEPGLVADADKQLLVVLLENLMGNAWKFTGRKDAASIHVGLRDGGRPAFYVRDNGAGFNMAYADKLFGAFQRLHSETEFEGTGIGLATVQRIVSRHGGRVWAEGAVGRGATFFFTLEPDR